MMAMETNQQERWCEAEVYRVAGEIALLSPERDAAKAAAYFQRALEIARLQRGFDDRSGRRVAQGASQLQFNVYRRWAAALS